MKQQAILTYAFLHALGVVMYVALIATLIANGEFFIGPLNNAVGPMIFLLAFVTSAAIMGMLVFARPIIWYLDSKKQEAILLAVSTICFLVLLTALIFVFLALAQV